MSRVKSFHPSSYVAFCLWTTIVVIMGSRFFTYTTQFQYNSIVVDILVEKQRLVSARWAIYCIVITSLGCSQWRAFFASLSLPSCPSYTHPPLVSWRGSFITFMSYHVFTYTTWLDLIYSSRRGRRARWTTQESSHDHASLDGLPSTYWCRLICEIMQYASTECSSTPGPTPLLRGFLDSLPRLRQSVLCRSNGCRPLKPNIRARGIHGGWGCWGVEGYDSMILFSILLGGHGIMIFCMGSSYDAQCALYPRRTLHLRRMYPRRMYPRRTNGLSG